MWKEILFVGIGGAFGSIISFVLSRLVIRYVAIEWTFAFENLRLIQTNQWGLFAFYTLTSIILGLVAIWGGMKLVRVLNRYVAVL